MAEIIDRAITRLSIVLLSTEVSIADSARPIEK